MLANKTAPFLHHPRSNITFFQSLTLHWRSLTAAKSHLSEKLTSTTASSLASAQHAFTLALILLLVFVIILPLLSIWYFYMIRYVETFITQEKKDIDSNRARLVKYQQSGQKILAHVIPSEIVDKLVVDKRNLSQEFQTVTVIHAEVAGFNDDLLEKLSANLVMMLMEDLYKRWDELMEKYGITMLEVNGGKLIAISGAPSVNGIRHAAIVARFAIELNYAVGSLRVPSQFGTFRLKTGVATGRVMAGVLGFRLPHYSVFGEATTKATALFDTGEAGKIQISEYTNRILSNVGGFVVRQRDPPIQHPAVQRDTHWLIKSDQLPIVIDG